MRTVLQVLVLLLLLAISPARGAGNEPGPFDLEVKRVAEACRDEIVASSIFC